VDLELRRKGVTLQLLWEEYAREHEGRAYQYSWFCERHHEVDPFQWTGWLRSLLTCSLLPFELVRGHVVERRM